MGAALEACPCLGGPGLSWMEPALREVPRLHPDPARLALGSLGVPRDHLLIGDLGSLRLWGYLAGSWGLLPIMRDMCQGWVGDLAGQSRYQAHGPQPPARTPSSEFWPGLVFRGR